MVETECFHVEEQREMVPATSEVVLGERNNGGGKGFSFQDGQKLKAPHPPLTSPLVTRLCKFICGSSRIFAQHKSEPLENPGGAIFA